MEDETHMLRAVVKATGPLFKGQDISVEASTPSWENGALGLLKQGLKACGYVVIKTCNSDWDIDPATKQTGTWIHILLAEIAPLVSDLMKLKFLMFHCRKNSVRDKKW